MNYARVMRCGYTSIELALRWFDKFDLQVKTN